MTGRFAPRPTRSLGVATINGWSLKRYEITVDTQPVADEIWAAAELAIGETLAPAPDPGSVGFAIVHLGSRVWLLIDTWREDIMYQTLLCAPLTDPTNFQEAEPGPTACVWELVVHAHEREACVRHLLDPADGPDVPGYLADVVTVPLRSNTDLVRAFDAAWLARDVDALMDLMTDDPAYLASTGADPGVSFRGADEVRAGFAAFIEAEGNRSCEAS